MAAEREGETSDLIHAFRVLDTPRCTSYGSLSSPLLPFPICVHQHQQQQQLICIFWMGISFFGRLDSPRAAHTHTHTIQTPAIRCTATTTASQPKKRRSFPTRTNLPIIILPQLVGKCSRRTSLSSFFFFFCGCCCFYQWQSKSLRHYIRWNHQQQQPPLPNTLPPPPPPPP